MPTPRYTFDPFQEIRRELDQVFDRFLGEGLFPQSAERLERATISPQVDIAKEDDSLRIEIDLPGVDPEDVECTLAENVLTVKGERRKQKVEGRAGLQERQFGRFERSITMPDDIDEDKLEARFDRGVLTITAPMKSGGGQPRQIKIAGTGQRAIGGGQQAAATQAQPGPAQAKPAEEQ